MKDFNPVTSQVRETDLSFAPDQYHFEVTLTDVMSQQKAEEIRQRVAAKAKMSAVEAHYDAANKLLSIRTYVHNAFACDARAYVESFFGLQSQPTVI